MVIRWGILATGGIAAKFTEDLRLVPDAEVVAVGSRTAEAAQAFAKRYGIPRAHGTWADLAADEDVDVVYVATPHNAHYAAAHLCIEAGKAVLVEKPFTLNAESARRLVDTGRERGVFVMEAMWTRTLPAILRLVELIGDGAIGEVTTVHADFGLQGPFDPTHRLRDPALGGGALLDLGIYPVTLAHLVLGVPSTVQATAKLTPEGVDENTALLFGYPSGAIATLTCGIVGHTGTTAAVTGTAGRIDVPAPFHCARGLVLHRQDKEPEEIEAGFDGSGLQFEAAEVNRCLREGLTESPLVPVATTVEILTILDSVRAQLGVVYPEENSGRTTK